MHLQAKFRQSAVLFLTEYEKMDYIRDHCKIIAFDILKARADPMSDDPYVTSKEMIEELHSMFGEYDKLIKCDVELHDPAFAMGMGFKKNEIFDEFYARFSAIVASLGYSEIYKISVLKRLIITKLRLQILDGIISSYRQYVERLRRCDQNLRLWAKIDVEEIDEEEFLTAIFQHTTSYSEEFKVKLKKNGRCFKCLGHDHKPNQTDACRDSAPLSFEEAKAMLVREREEKTYEKE